MTTNESVAGGGTGERRRAGQLEAQIVTALVDAGTPLTPGEVRDRLDSGAGLSYSAVVTTLTRLHDKGAVIRQRRGRAFRYAPIEDAAGRMSRLLAAEPDHASVLRRFVGALNQGDEQILRQLLDNDSD